VLIKRRDQVIEKTRFTKPETFPKNTKMKEPNVASPTEKNFAEGGTERGRERNKSGRYYFESGNLLKGEGGRKVRRGFSEGKWSWERLESLKNRFSSRQRDATEQVPTGNRRARQEEKKSPIRKESHAFRGRPTVEERML